jgi:uncharacterized protein
VNAARRGFAAVGAPIRALLIGSIRVYRATLSGVLGGQCRFEPSCSVYAEQAIRSRGALRGSVLALWRVLRCNPFGRPGFDPAPGDNRIDGRRYDDVVHGTSTTERVEARV